MVKFLEELHQYLTWLVLYELIIIGSENDMTPSAEIYLPQERRKGNRLEIRRKDGSDQAPSKELREMRAKV